MNSSNCNTGKELKPLLTASFQQQPQQQLPVKKKNKNKQQQQSNNKSFSATSNRASAAEDVIFRNTYKCPHKNCNAVFSRAYTYKVHLKTHDTFARYHEFKKLPQLYLDSDSQEMHRLNDEDFRRSVSLAPMVSGELNSLLLQGSEGEVGGEGSEW